MIALLLWTISIAVAFAFGWLFGADSKLTRAMRHRVKAAVERRRLAEQAEQLGERRRYFARRAAARE